jgi:hypothetical protein
MGFSFGDVLDTYAHDVLKNEKRMKMHRASCASGMSVKSWWRYASFMCLNLNPLTTLILNGTWWALAHHHAQSHQISSENLWGGDMCGHTCYMLCVSVLSLCSRAMYASCSHVFLLWVIYNQELKSLWIQQSFWYAPHGCICYPPLAGRYLISQFSKMGVFLSFLIWLGNRFPSRDSTTIRKNKMLGWIDVKSSCVLLVTISPKPRTHASREGMYNRQVIKLFSPSSSEPHSTHAIV